MAKIRSPNYPTMGLSDAIEKARVVFEKENRHKAGAAVIAKAMGYSGLNGASLSAVSALRKYGLLEGADGGLRITQDAVTILVDPKDSEGRAEAIMRAAFAPALFAELRDEYGGELPSDDNLRAFLIKRGFSPSTVAVPIRSYRDTLTFVSDIRKVCLSGSQKGGQDDSAKADGENPLSNPDVAVGDLIQWASGDVLQFDKPRRVRAIQQHAGVAWVFVEGSDTGIPMGEITVEQKGVAGPPKPTPPVLPEVNNVFRAVAGEREWLRGPLSKDSSYRLVVMGDLGPKEIGKLIKLLEAQKAVLSDDDEETEH